MPIYIDTHSHLYLPDFDSDREATVNRAVNSGVYKILLPNIDSTSIKRMNSMVSQFSGICYPMIGLHPTSVKETWKKELELVEQELKRGSYIGIGEIGIDLYWDKTFLEQQLQVFAAQLDLSLQYRLPVAVHARESFTEILDILESYKGKGLKGVFHAFTGTAEIAKLLIQYGFKLGIGGIITYKNSPLSDVIHDIELEHILLETDSPYLAPVPFRGKRNESAYIPYIAETIQKIKNVSLDAVAGTTTQNTLELFSL